MGRLKTRFIWTAFEESAMWFELHPSLVPALAVLASLCLAPRPAEAQAVVPTPVAAQAAPDLRVLVARIALYPDDVLSLVLPASTAALDVVEATRYLDKHQADKSLAPDPDWDPSVLALLNYPEALRLMDSDLDWTNQLGQAVADDLNGVLDAIQAIRSEAADAGYLATNDKIAVTRDPDQPVTIRSTDPDIAYVPVYQSTTVVNQTYASAPPLAYANPYLSYQSPAAPFFAGLLFGTAIGYGLDWDDDDIDIDVHDVDWDDIDWDRVDWDDVGRLRPDINVDGDVNFNNFVNNGILKNTDRTALQSRIDTNRQSFQAAHGRLGDGTQRQWQPRERPAGGLRQAGNRQPGQGLAPTRQAAAEGLRQRQAGANGAGRVRVGDAQPRRGDAFGGVQPRRETGRAASRGRESLDLPRRSASIPDRQRPASSQIGTQRSRQAPAVRQGGGGGRPFGGVSSGSRSRAESARGHGGGGGRLQRR
jgi:hypothetical protein